MNAADEDAGESLQVVAGGSAGNGELWLEDGVTVSAGPWSWSPRQRGD